MKVNWDDDIPNINGKIKLMFQTTNQLVVYGSMAHLESSPHHQGVYAVTSGRAKMGGGSHRPL